MCQPHAVTACIGMDSAVHCLWVLRIVSGLTNIGRTVIGLRSLCRLQHQHLLLRLSHVCSSHDDSALHSGVVYIMSLLVQTNHSCLAWASHTPLQ